MSKKICLDYNANLKSQILLADFIKNNLNKINNFLHIVAKRDESLIVKLLPLYKKLLDKMAIDSTKKAFFNQFNFPFIENKWLNEYPDFIPLVENATLKFLNFTKYKSHFVIGEKLDVFYRDVIRGEFYPLYYLAFT